MYIGDHGQVTDVIQTAASVSFVTSSDTADECPFLAAVTVASLIRSEGFEDAALVVVVASSVPAATRKEKASLARTVEP
jgi:hypothetical protein